MGLCVSVHTLPIYRCIAIHLPCSKAKSKQDSSSDDSIQSSYSVYLIYYCFYIRLFGPRVGWTYVDWSCNPYFLCAVSKVDHHLPTKIAINGHCTRLHPDYTYRQANNNRSKPHKKARGEREKRKEGLSLANSMGLGCSRKKRFPFEKFD